VRFVHRECDRARQRASIDVDGELSEFERALLDAHLADCQSCGEFRREIAGLTQAVRIAQAAQLTRPIEIARVRRRYGLRLAPYGLRLAPAAAVMTVAVLGLGSLVASTQLHSGSVGNVVVHHARSFKFDPDAAAAAVRQPVVTRVLAQSSVHGGPVLFDR
jgi:predicted anti-sigma-YlaC factor YlaD